MKTLFCLFFCLLCFEINAQTRMFISAGYSGTEFTGSANLNLGLANKSISIGAYTEDATFGRYLCFDLTIERRLFGPYYWLSGIKFNQTGYQYAEYPYTSSLKSSYLSLPLLVRVNMYNGNIMYLDFGFLQNFLVKADLRESFYDISDQQNIARHLSRFSTSFYFEFMIAYRRVAISMTSQSKTFGSSKDFSDDWNLERERSLFLLYFGNYFFKSGALKLTYRIR